MQALVDTQHDKTATTGSQIAGAEFFFSLHACRCRILRAEQYCLAPAASITLS